MGERVVHLPAESRGEAPGRGRMTGRRVLVVGGGQMEIGEADTPVGNGRAMSILVAREGASVAVADRIGESAAATVAAIAAEGGTGHAITADVTHEADVNRMVDEAVERWAGSTGWCSMSASAPAGTGWKARRPRTGTRSSPSISAATC